MKDWKDIEKMNPEQLGKAAAGVPVPEGWENRLTELVDGLDKAGQVLGERKSRRPLLLAAVSAAAAAVLAAGLLWTDRTPRFRDTYDDPALAYAEVERAFELFASKMQYGTEKVYESIEMIEKPLKMLK